LLEHRQVLRTWAAANTSASTGEVSGGLSVQRCCGAHRGCDVSIHGDIQDPTNRSNCPCFEQGFGLDDLWMSLPTSVIL